MDALGINWKILFGQIINFAILLYLLKRFAYKPFLSILEKRRTKIEEGMKKTEEAEKSFQKIKVLGNEIRERGEKEAKEIIKEAQLRAETKKEEVLNLAEKEKEKIIEQAKKMAEKEAFEIKKKQEKEMIEKTFLLTEKFLQEKLDCEKDKKFIEEIFADLKQ